MGQSLSLLSLTPSNPPSATVDETVRTVLALKRAIEVADLNFSRVKALRGEKLLLDKKFEWVSVGGVDGAFTIYH